MATTKRKKRNGGRGFTNDPRNAALVELRDLNEEKYSFAYLGEIFGIDKKTAFDIYKQEKARNADK